jgi:hypothetical protein
MQTEPVYFRKTNDEGAQQAETYFYRPSPSRIKKAVICLPLSLLLIRCGKAANGGLCICLDLNSPGLELFVYIF